MSDYVDWESMYVVVNELGIRGYQMKHFDICKNIWKTLVPKKGQADTLQGELLRQVEKLRNEACDNGNINWDDNFEWFCDFLKETLGDSGLFDEKQMHQLNGALDYMKECGNYAASYNSGEITDEEVDPIKFAYTEDDLYDFIEDAVAVYAKAHPENITYEHKNFIYR